MHREWSLHHRLEAYLQHCISLSRRFVLYEVRLKKQCIVVLVQVSIVQDNHAYCQKPLPKGTHSGNHKYVFKFGVLFDCF